MTVTVTPLEALRRLISACKLIDFADCKDETVWQALADAQGVAEGVVRDFPKSDIIISQRLRDAAEDPMWDGHAEVSKRLLILAAENMEVARARIVELEVAPVAAQPSEAVQSIGAAPEMLLPEQVEWITNDNAELGVKIGNQFFFLYKGHSLVYENGMHDDDTPMQWRPVFKREFGECAHPINHADYSKIGTVSLSDSDEWKVLPPAIPTAAVSAAPSGEVERDAERYRWLRESSVGQWTHPIVVEQLRDRKFDRINYIGPLSGCALDAAIDAAKSAQGEKK